MTSGIVERDKPGQMHGRSRKGRCAGLYFILLIQRGRRHFIRTNCQKNYA
jgi:hypothetical protein